MKNYKGNMLLIELLIVILFFSLSQLVVVRLFAAAYEKATASSVLSDALLCGQDLTERLSAESNPDAMLLREGFTGGNGYYVWSDARGFDLLVSLQRESSPAGDLIVSSVTARRNGETLFTLPGANYRPKEAGI